MIVEAIHAVSRWSIRRPAVGLAAWTAGGIVAHSVAPWSPGIGLIGVGGLLIVALLLRHRDRWANLAVGLAAMGIGCAGAQLRETRFSSTSIAHHLAERPRLARVMMTIASPPQVVEPTGLSAIPRGEQTRFLADVKRIATPSGWADADGTVRVSIGGVEPRLGVGQTIVALGWLARAGRPMNPGQFDFAEHDRRLGIAGVLGVDSPGNLQIRDPAPISLLWTVRRIVRERLAAGFSADHSLDHKLLAALLLGDRDAELNDIRDQFVATGTSHHLAISGMHVAVLGAVVFFLFRLLQRPPRVTVGAGMGFVILYALVTVPSPPVLRAAGICVALGAGMLGRRRGDPLQLLALAMVALMWINPLDLYGPGFQLSFGCVAGLIVLTPAIGQLLGGGREPAGAPGFATRPATWSSTLIDKLRTALAAGLAAWLVSLPLVMWHFDRVNPWAIGGSLILGIPVFFGLVGGLLKVILSLLFPWASSWWAILASGPMIVMRKTVAGLAALPGSDLAFPAPPVGLVILFYVILLIGLAPWAKVKWWLRWNPAALALGAVLFPLVLGFARDSTGPVRVAVLAVGAGSCGVVETADRRVVVFDAGSSTLADAQRSVIGPYLRRRGIGAVDAIYISHANTDHYGAVADLVEAHRVGRVYAPTGFAESAGHSPAGRRLLATLADRGVALTTTGRGDRAVYGPVEVEVIWPGGESGWGENDRSLVTRVTTRGRSVLFTGDIQDAAEVRLLEGGAALGADALVAPHHGSAEATTPAFLSAVGARWIVSSSSSRLTGKQRAFDALAPEGLRTGARGAITITIDQRGRMAVETYR